MQTNPTCLALEFKVAALLPQKRFFKLFFIAALFLGAFVHSTAANANSAPFLHPIPAQLVFPEQALVYKVTASDTDGTVPSIRMLNAPVNATLTDEGDGSRTFTWQVPANVANETIIIFQAVDADDPGLVSTRRLVLTRGESVEPTASSSSTTTDSQTNSQRNQNRAPILPEIGLQTLRVNENYQLFVRPVDDDGSVGGVFADSLPAGATFEDAFDGGRVFRWTPAVEQIGSHRLTLIAFDAADKGLRSRRDVEFKVIASNGDASASTNNTSDNTPTEPAEEPPEPASKEAYIESISSPIVSAGQVVSFRVVPRMPDKSVAILHVDRLPNGASFDDNYDGTRTFYWPTTDKDQGRHLFRFTAIHHSNSNERVSAEVMIVVGDPAAPGSQPANNSENLPDQQSGQNTAPVITPVPQQRVAINRDLRFKVVALDNDGSIPSLYLENPPEHVKFEDNGDGTREFYWTPNNKQVGEHQFAVVAADARDPSLTDRFTLNINVIGEDNATTLPPPVLVSDKRPASRSDAARFLQRATFGPRSADVDALMQQSYSDWIANQINLPQTRYLDGVDSVLREYGLQQITDGQRQFDRQQIRSDEFWNIAVNAPDQLRQRVAFALGQILVVSDKDAGLDNRVRGIAAYHDLLAEEAFGNYRDLLGRVTLNPMMGDFLSMRRNEKPDVENNIQSDENYAREMMQLFTLGLSRLQMNGEPQTDGGGNELPTYTQDDVVNLARVFTGWNYGDADSMRSSRRSYQSEIIEMKPFEAFHDTNAKTIVGGVQISAGLSARDELNKALDAIFNHQNVAPFVSKQIIQRLVTSNPSPGYVNRVANAFADNGSGVRGDMSAVVKATLLDDEALTGHVNNAGIFGKLKEPVIKIASIWRAFDARGAFNRFRYSGINADFLQSPYSAPSVFNFYSASYKPPGELGNRNITAPEAQILNDTTILKGADRLFDYAHAVPLGNSNNSNQHSMLLKLDFEKSIAGDVPKLVDHLKDKLLAGTMSDSLKATLLELGNTTPMTDNGEQRVRELLYIIFISPEFAVQR